MSESGQHPSKTIPLFIEARTVLYFGYFGKNFSVLCCLIQTKKRAAKRPPFTIRWHMAF